MSDEDSLEKIESMAEDIQTTRELKTLIYHQDFVYNNTIKPEIETMIQSGKKETAQAFKHYNNTYKKMVAHMFVELLLLKNPDKEKEEIIEDIREA